MTTPWPSPSGGAEPLIGFGQVRHTRLKPARHAFVYPTYFLMLPMRSLQGRLRCYSNDSDPVADSWSVPGFSVNEFAALSFFDADHGDGRSPRAGGALAWLDDLLMCEGILDADGEAWLHCYPRVWGYTFKPVSFWYCHRASGELRAIVVEVNNTFGERHCYLLDDPHYGQELRAVKTFHVSPFCAVQGQYRFRFMRTERDDLERTVVRIDHDDATGPLLQTSVSGDLHALNAATVRRALWRYPAMTFGLIARIHWQALKLALKRVPYFSKPTPPKAFVTR